MEEENIHPTLTMATAIDPRFVEYFNFFNCSTCEELYAKLEQIHMKHKPVEGEHVPFSLQDLKHLNTIDVKLCLSNIGVPIKLMN